MATKRIICLLTAFVLLAAACGSGSGSSGGSGAQSGGESSSGSSSGSDSGTSSDAGSEETAAAAETEDAGAKDNVRFVYPGGENKHHAEITKYINDLLDRDNMGIAFTAMPIGWDVWEQKINLMFQSRDEFEFVQVPEGFGPGYVLLWNRGASTRLNELLDEHAPTVKNVVPGWLWEAASIEGNITTIPAFWVETAHLKGGITLRRDLYDKYGMSLPTNLEELVSKSVELKANIEAEDLFDEPTYVMMRYQEIQTFPHRTYNTYPFTVIDQILLVRQDGTVESWVDSQEFKWDCEFYNSLYENGLIYAESLSLTTSEAAPGFGYGNYLFSEWNTLNSDPFMKKTAGDDSIVNEYVIFNMDKKIMRDQGVRNSNIVSSTSPNPAAAVRFHEWFYANEDAYYALQFGIEGLTYNIVEGVPDFIADEPNLGIADWMVANINLQPPYLGSNPDWIRLTMNEEMNSDNSVTIGFAFDPSPVDVEYSNCLSELQNVIYPLRAGIVSYAEGYAAASAALESAGINKLVDAYQGQLKAWLSSK